MHPQTGGWDTESNVVEHHLSIQYSLLPSEQQSGSQNMQGFTKFKGHQTDP